MMINIRVWLIREEDFRCRYRVRGEHGYGGVGRVLGTTKDIAYLVLNQELHTLNGSSGSFRNGGSNTTHCDKLLVQSIEAECGRLTQKIYHEAVV
jgi:hypothetical protein